MVYHHMVGPFGTVAVFVTGTLHATAQTIPDDPVVDTSYSFQIATAGYTPFDLTLPFVSILIQPNSFATILPDLPYDIKLINVAPVVDGGPNIVVTFYDADGDGFTVAQGDCHDGNGAINGNSVDENCDGMVGLDDRHGRHAFSGKYGRHVDKTDARRRAPRSVRAATSEAGSRQRIRSHPRRTGPPEAVTTENIRATLRGMTT